MDELLRLGQGPKLGGAGMIGIQRIDHVGVRVRDKTVSVAFYESLGFKTLSDTGFEQGHPIIMEHPSGIVINVLGPATAEPGPNVLMDVELKHPGYTHIALRVDSLEATRAFMEAQGIPVTGGFEFGGVRALFIRDPDGNVLEFDERRGADESTRAMREPGC